MKLRKLELANFCQHRALNVEFAPGVTVIVGGNGKGKSNLLRSLLFATTGESGNAGARTEDYNWQADGSKSPGYVKLTFDEPTGVVKRSLTSSTTSLKIGDKSIRKTADANAELLQLFGVPKKTIQEIVFVMQGEIENIMFDRPSDRAKKFQALFGTAHIEQIREELMRTASAFAEQPDEERLAELEARLEREIDPEIRRIDDQKRELETIISAVDVDELKRVISSYEQVASQSENRSKLELQTSQLETEIGSLDNQINELQPRIDELVKLIDEQSHGANQATQRKSIATSANTLCDQRAQCEQLIAEAEASTTDVTPDQIDELSRSLAISEAELERLNTCYEQFKDGTQRQCPTCLQQVDKPHVVAGFASEMATRLAPEITSTRAMLEAAARQLAAHEKKQANAELARQSLAHVKKSLEAMGVLERVDDAELRQIDETINQFNYLKQQHEVAAGELSQLQSRREHAGVRLESLREQLNSLSGGQTSVSEYEYKEAQAALVTFDEARLSVAGLSGQVKQLQGTRRTVLLELENLKARVGKADAAKKYRDYCERARAVLHRDVLPRAVTQRFLKRVNTELQYYLDEFSVPFSAEIMDDLSVTAVIPGAGEKSAHRLSGGEKTLLGLAFRFAIYSLFSSKLGFMVLDEPTASLDETNINSVVENFQEMRRYAQNAGLQIAVVTHHVELERAADQLVRL